MSLEAPILEEESRKGSNLYGIVSTPNTNYGEGRVEGGGGGGRGKSGGGRWRERKLGA
jgi:hypothetical protein